MESTFTYIAGSTSFQNGLSCLFSFTQFTEKAVRVNGIQTQNVLLEGKHADHLTTITAHCCSFYYCFINGRLVLKFTELSLLQKACFNKSMSPTFN